jgi:hypothetical protein
MTSFLKMRYEEMSKNRGEVEVPENEGMRGARIVYRA